MCIAVRLLDDGLGILYEVKGRAGLPQAASAQAIVRDYLEEAKFLIVDFTAADLSDLGEAEIKGIIQGDLYLASMNPEIVQAIVAPGDLSYGIGRIYTARIEGNVWPTQVFRARDEATSWLQTQVDETLTFSPGPSLSEESP